jgi:hypothetical protein
MDNDARADGGTCPTLPWDSDWEGGIEDQIKPSEHVFERLHKEGYRAGRAQGSERVLQEGFDEGFEAGFAAARALGRLYSSACQTLDEAGLRKVEKILLEVIPERGCVLPEDFNALSSLLSSQSIYASEISSSPSPGPVGDEVTTPR